MSEWPCTGQGIIEERLSNGRGALRFGRQAETLPAATEQPSRGFQRVQGV
jgi:hypothetical protein